MQFTSSVVGDICTFTFAEIDKKTSYYLQDWSLVPGQCPRTWTADLLTANKFLASHGYPAHPTKQVLGSPYDVHLSPDQRESLVVMARSPRAFLNTSDVGTGKTRMALCGALATRVDAPVIVLTLKTPKRQWAQEATKIAYRGCVELPQEFRAPMRGEIVIFNYEQLPPLSKEGNAKKAPLEEHLRHLQPNTVIILDECQKLSNNKTAVTLRARGLINAVYKKKGWILGCTATPVQNKEQEYWNMLTSLKLHKFYFGNYQNFCRLFGGRLSPRYNYMEFDQSRRDQEQIKKHLSQVTFRLRHQDGKKVIEVPVFVDITNKKLIEDLDMLNRNLEQLNDDDVLNWALSFGNMSRIKQSLNKEKLKHLQDIIADLEQRGPLVFVCTNVDPVEELGRRKGWGSVTGQTPQKQREALTEQFLGGKLKGLALGARAGGEGLNLNNCNQMLFLDLDYNPAKNKQAKGRVRRRDNPHDLYSIHVVYADHPLDRRLAEILERKEALIDSVVGD